MAVTFDASSELTPFSTLQNPSWTHTPVGVPTGVGIAVAMRDVGLDVSVASVTYGGQICTFENSQTCDSGNIIVAIYSLANPPSGAQTVQINLTPSGPDRGISGYAVTVTGGSTSDVFGAVAKASGNNAAPTVDVASDTDELVMDILGLGSGFAVSEYGAGQTPRFDEDISSALAYGTTEPGTSPTVTMSYTASGANNWGIVAASFNPADAAPPPPSSVVPARKMKIWSYA